MRCAVRWPAGDCFGVGPRMQVVSSCDPFLTHVKAGPVPESVSVILREREKASGDL